MLWSLLFPLLIVVIPGVKVEFTRSAVRVLGWFVRRPTLPGDCRGKLQDSAAGYTCFRM